MTMTISSTPNYSLMKKMAEEVLLSIDCPVLPIRIMPLINYLTDNNFLIVNTFEQYIKNESMDYEVFLRENGSKDGTLRYFPIDNSFTLLYNKNIQQERKIWTIAHELGHYYAKHNVKKYNYIKMHKMEPEEFPEEFDIAFEKEANCFAREFLSPTSLIQVAMGLLQVSDFVGIYTIVRSLFRLSQEASYHVATSMTKIEYPNYSKKLCLKYESAINNFFSIIEDRNSFYVLLLKYQREIDSRDHKQRMIIKPIGFDYY